MQVLIRYSGTVKHSKVLRVSKTKQSGYVKAALKTTAEGWHCPATQINNVIPACQNHNRSLNPRSTSSTTRSCPSGSSRRADGTRSTALACAITSCAPSTRASWWWPTGAVSSSTSHPSAAPLTSRPPPTVLESARWVAVKGSEQHRAVGFWTSNADNEQTT